MKKIAFLMALVAMMAQSAMAATEADLKAKQDSLSMLYGQYFGKMVSLMSKQNSKMNTAEFAKAFDLVMTADTANLGYMNGFMVATTLYQRMEQLKVQNGVELNKDLMAAALKQCLGDTTVTDRDLMTVNSDMQVMESRTLEMAEALSPMALNNKKAGADYIAKLLASGEGYQKTASGLVYKMLAEGAGSNFGDSEDVKLTYKGMHVSGSVFDASRDTTTLNSGHVVPGFKEALMLMKPGSKMIAVMNSDLAYGDRGAGKDRRTGKYAIEPGETLIFEISTFGNTAAEAAPAVAPVTGKKAVRGKGVVGHRPRSDKKK